MRQRPKLLGAIITTSSANSRLSQGAMTQPGTDPGKGCLETFDIW